MIFGLLMIWGLAQDPVLTEANVDEFLRNELEVARGRLPERDVEGNVLSDVSISGRTLTHRWELPATLNTPQIALLDRTHLVACDDATTVAALRLGVKLRHVYRRQGADDRVFELAEDTCGGVRVSSSRQRRTIQATPTRLQAVDVRSVVEDDAILTFDFVDARPPTENAPDLGFQIFGYRMDCTSRTFAIQYVESLDRNGDTLAIDDRPRLAGPINPGTVMASVADRFCNRFALDEPDDRTLDVLLRAAWSRFERTS